MNNNPFYILMEGIEGCLEGQAATGQQAQPDNTTAHRPNTPTGQPTTLPTTPGKKRAKRAASSPIPNITPIKMAQAKAKEGKTATGYL
jgi:hypothetical protein